MKHLLLTLPILLTLSGQAFAQAATQPVRNASLRQEIQLAYSRGLHFLRDQQDSQNGNWGRDEPVAFTGLITACFLLEPGRQPSDPLPVEADLGLQYLVSQAKEDGGIYTQGRSNYNTALAMMALLMAPKPEYEQVMLQARRYLVTRQMDLDGEGMGDNPLDGGFGYGDGSPHADLSNTHFTLEALHYAEALFTDRGDALKDEPKLNFAAAIEFIERCQNRPESNDAPWVSQDPADHGGFVYGPTETRGEEIETGNGRVAFRSYGSISYAAMMSFIYAGLDKSDPRVKAALDWLSSNYTLEENPGMGFQAHFYYFHTMAKALNAAQVDLLELDNGRTIDWRVKLAEELLNRQRGDGSWVNTEASRWMESDPQLVTGYVLMALARINEGL